MELPEQFKTWIDFYRVLLRNAEEAGETFTPDHVGAYSWHTTRGVQTFRFKMADVMALAFLDVLPALPEKKVLHELRRMVAVSSNLMLRVDNPLDVALVKLWEVAPDK